VLELPKSLAVCLVLKRVIGDLTMTERLDPESIDLADLAKVLRASCGPVLPGDAVGKTRIRDQLVIHLNCSELEAELLVDTMIARGFVKRREQTDRLVFWEL